MGHITAANARINELIMGAKFCFQNDLWLPGLCLVYIAIDTCAALDRPEGATRSGRAEFIAWVQDFLLPESTFGCSALDLYGARCGLLHQQSPRSELFEEAKVKQLWYVHGPTAVEDLQTAADKSKVAGRVVVLHVDQLFQAFLTAQTRFAEALEKDSERAARVLERADQHKFGALDDVEIHRLAGVNK